MPSSHGRLREVSGPLRGGAAQLSSAAGDALALPQPCRRTHGHGQPRSPLQRQACRTTSFLVQPHWPRQLVALASCQPLPRPCRPVQLLLEPHLPALLRPRAQQGSRPLHLGEARQLEEPL